MAAASSVHSMPAPALATAVAASLRSAILQGNLSPGEQIRQAEWADRVGTSRIPVREALKSLAAEGLLSHDHNRGYFVTRFGPREMVQIYLMRRLIEAELIRSLDLPRPGTIKRLRELGESAARAKMGDDFDVWNDLEHRFHTDMYALSPMSLVRDEFERLWLLSNIYRHLNMAALGLPPDAPAVTYYASMVNALEVDDRDRMMALMTQLREGSQRRYMDILSRRYAFRRGV